MRELITGTHKKANEGPRGLVQQTKSLGWGMLDEDPGHEIAMGAITQPWLADVVFRPIAPARFRGYGEPDHVKIVWNLRTDPAPGNAGATDFSTETRVKACDSNSRSRFRRYWRWASPGIILIRWMLLRTLKRQVEH